MGFTTTVTSAVTVLAVAMLALPSPASAQEPGRLSPGTAASVAIVAPALIRADKQSYDTPLVVFTGIDSQTRVRVSFGDDQGTDTDQGRCRVPFAANHPDSCTVPMSHRYDTPGTYTITAIVGTTTIQQLITITAPPIRWTPPAGWVQPTGWTVLWQRATFFPCEQVTWHLDRAAETPDRATTIDDIRTSLAMLAAETGLAFTETNDPAQAMLTFNWGDLTGRGPNVAGVGGPQGLSRAGVTLSIHSPWTTDSRGGITHNIFGRPMAGRVWLIVHEVMHGLGIGHVDDATQVMNPVGGAAALGSGDRDALRTLYLNNPCPIG